MHTRHATNWLLAAILGVLLLRLLSALRMPTATAETFRLDNCITRSLDEVPGCYVHVITHSLPAE